MVKGRGIDHHEVAQVVLAGRIVAVPGHHVEWRVVLPVKHRSALISNTSTGFPLPHVLGLKEGALKAAHNGVLLLLVLVRRHGRQKIPRIGQAVGTCPHKNVKKEEDEVKKENKKK